MKSGLSRLSAAASASTGASASPSLSPLSRFSEWRISRGTRGLVTTDELSTGSVGESSAPTRKLSVHVRSVTHVRGHGDDPAGHRHPDRKVARRQVPRALQHLGLDLQPVAEQDHDQRDDRELAHEARLGVEVEHAQSPPWPSTNPVITNSAVSDRKLRCAIPDRSAPPTRQAPNTTTAVSKECTGIESPKTTMRVTVLGKSPSWQDAGGACSGYLIEEGDIAVLMDCGNGVFSKLRNYRDYVDVDAVVISHLHADHFLDLVPFSYALTYAPRQQPVPVASLAGHRHAGAPEAARAAPARARRSAASSAPGATRT